MLRFNSLQSRSLFAAAKGVLAICSLILFLAPAAPVRAETTKQAPEASVLTAANPQ